MSKDKDYVNVADWTRTDSTDSYLSNALEDPSGERLAYHSPKVMPKSLGGGRHNQPAAASPKLKLKVKLPLDPRTHVRQMSVSSYHAPSPPASPLLSPGLDHLGADRPRSRSHGTISPLVSPGPPSGGDGPPDILDPDEEEVFVKENLPPAPPPPVHRLRTPGTPPVQNKTQMPFLQNKTRIPGTPPLLQNKTRIPGTPPSLQKQTGMPSTPPLTERNKHLYDKPSPMETANVAYDTQPAVQNGIDMVPPPPKPHAHGKNPEYVNQPSETRSSGPRVSGSSVGGPMGSGSSVGGSSVGGPMGSGPRVSGQRGSDQRMSGPVDDPEQDDYVDMSHGLTLERARQNMVDQGHSQGQRERKFQPPAIGPGSYDMEDEEGLYQAPPSNRPLTSEVTDYEFRKDGYQRHPSNRPVPPEGEQQATPNGFYDDPSPMSPRQRELGPKASSTIGYDDPPANRAGQPDVRQDALRDDGYDMQIEQEAEQEDIYTNQPIIQMERERKANSNLSDTSNSSQPRTARGSGESGYDQPPRTARGPGESGYDHPPRTPRGPGESGYDNLHSNRPTPEAYTEDMYVIPPSNQPVRGTNEDVYLNQGFSQDDDGESYSNVPGSLDVRVPPVVDRSPRDCIADQQPPVIDHQMVEVDIADGTGREPEHERAHEKLVRWACRWRLWLIIAALVVVVLILIIVLAVTLSGDDGGDDVQTTSGMITTTEHDVTTRGQTTYDVGQTTLPPITTTITPTTTAMTNTTADNSTQADYTSETMTSPISTT